jgi:hypothetical protein
MSIALQNQLTELERRVEVVEKVCEKYGIEIVTALSVLDALNTKTERKTLSLPKKSNAKAN